MRRPLLAILTTLFVAPAAFAADAKPVKVLIITGDEYHKWKETAPFLKEVLTKAGHKVDVTQTPSKDLTSENLAKYEQDPAAARFFGAFAELGCFLACRPRRTTFSSADVSAVAVGCRGQHGRSGHFDRGKRWQDFQNLQFR